MFSFGLVYIALNLRTLVSMPENTTTFFVNPVLEGSISLHCSPVPSRSVLELTSLCASHAKCRGVAKAKYNPQFFECSCAANPAIMNIDIGTFFSRKLIAFLKGSQTLGSLGCSAYFSNIANDITRSVKYMFFNLMSCPCVVAVKCLSNKR